MTLIAAVAEDGYVHMLADTMTVDSGTDQVYVSTDKVWMVGEFLIGASGDTRNCQVVRYLFQPPKLGATADLMTYLVRDFVPALQEVHRQAGTLHQEQGGVLRTECLLLVGVRGQLFEVDGSFCVMRQDNHAALGAGAQVALGVLSGNHDLSPRSRLTQAGEAAARLISCVGGPFEWRVLHPTALS